MAERRPPGFNVPLGFYDGSEVESIPKRIRAAAVGVWALAGNYAATQLTDGYVGPGVLKMIGCTDAIRAALKVTINKKGELSPLWIDARNGGIQLTNWPKHQRTNDEVTTYRASEAARKRDERSTKRNATTSENVKTSGRTSAGQGADVRPDDRDPKTKTETETEESGTPGGAHPRTPPPDHCRNHPNGNDIDDCGGCLRARKAFEQWQANEDAIEQLRADANHAELEHLRANLHRCPDCHGTHWVADDNGDPIRRCTHERLIEELAHV